MKRKYDPNAKPKEDATYEERFIFGDPYAKKYPALRYEGWVEPLDGVTIQKPLDKQRGGIRSY